MSAIKGLLFDMDGVITQTEKQYDIFLDKIRQEYSLSEDFTKKIKGVRLTDILNTYFGHYSQEEKKAFVDKVNYFETEQMVYDLIPGVENFLHTVKGKYSIALVTSSSGLKVKVALRKMQMENFFDIVVCADDIENGKPAPDGYLLAAKKLNLSPSECLVFEDSFAGIQAGTSAGMRVIGLATTHSADLLKDKVYKVIPDFNYFKIDF